MVSHTGHFLLLCCMGTMLSFYTSLTHQTQPEHPKILMELQGAAKMTWQNYQEKGLPERKNYTLPCLISECSFPRINSSAILAYFQEIQRVTVNNHTIQEIIQQLKKLMPQGAPRLNVTVPEDHFEQKCFTSAILQQFSNCMDRIHNAKCSTVAKRNVQSLNKLSVRRKNAGPLLAESGQGPVRGGLGS
ncbi:interleukin-31 [Orycteropus afer afer]|uniref:Interleukin-31 n=1 Tax=Orycteropus afer afer TaxID=1230840 RepID=A0A8B6ZLA7_ORYAF|nr:interleukin-31 [Orycteropus afer afer]